MRVAGEMLGAWSALEFDRAVALFTKDGILDSMVGEPMIGREVIKERTALMVVNMSFMEMNVLRMGVVDDHVMVERLDKYTVNGQDGTLAVVGIMQIEGGKVAQWREYFDRADWLCKLAAKAQ